MKRLAICVLAFLLLPFSAFSEETDQNFPDVSGTRSSDAVRFLKGEEVVEGYQDGTFRPEQQITRVEFLKIALEASDMTEAECSGAPKDFPDVAKGEWFYDVVCTALKSGIVDGYPDGDFRPHTLVNFAEASKIIARIEELDADQQEGDEWYREYVDALHKERVIPGTVDRNDKNITRGDMSEIIWGIKTGNEVENEDLGDVPEVATCAELTTQFQKYRKRIGYENSRGFIEGGGIRALPSISFAESADSSAEETSFQKSSSAGLGGGSADDFSSTNIQEFGVDEADIIKNNGSHIYMVKGNTVRIVRAYTPDNLEQVATITLDEGKFYPRELYLDDDVLTVIGNGAGDFYALRNTTATAETTEVSLIAPDYYPQQNALKVISFDVSDASQPEKIRSVSFDGSYVSSRKIGDVVYTVANKYANYYGWPEPIPLLGDVDMPVFKDSAYEEELYIASCDQVRYFPNFRDPNYMILAAIDTRDTSQRVEREMLLGSGQQVYASQDNLYVTRNQYDEIFFERGDDSGWRNEEFTEVFKFSLDGTDIDFVAKGKAPGRAINQFAMSEHDNYFRIATQRGNLWGDVKSTSNVYTFDADMDLEGRLEGLAPGEQMYSARFVGDRGYLVTFKKVDPLFVIDLSDPKNPEVLGELKIPGFSEYLHPYDENHIIGFGKDAAEPDPEDLNAWRPDFAWYQGMKLAIFDVSDVENPKQLHTELIGDRGTNSEVLYNHKALLFDAEKNLLAFPVTVHEVPNKTSSTPPETYGEPVFQGAYVYDISLSDGFELRGKATHYDDVANPTPEDEELYQEWFYNHDLNIQRMIYIGDYFYSISPNVITAWNYEDVSKANRITLDQKQCNEVWNEYECRSYSHCRAIEENITECYEDNEEMICSDVGSVFSRCEEK